MSAVQLDDPPRVERDLRPQSALADRSRVRRLKIVATASVLIAVVAVLCLPPIYFLLEAAHADGFSGLKQMVDDPTLGRTLTVTVILAVGSAVISTVLGTVLAWGAQRLPRRRRWLGYLPLIPLVMPALAAVTGFTYMLSPRIGYGNVLLRKLPFFSDLDSGPIDVFTVQWIVIITAILLTSFVFLFVRSALSQFDQDVYDAAATSGASPVRTFLTIVVPLLRPAITYAVLTVMLLAIGQFAVPLFLGRQENVNVLSTAMFNSMQFAPPNVALAAAYGVPIIITGIVFILVQRFVLKDQERFVTSGSRGASKPLRESGWGEQLALAVFGLFAVVGPVVCVAIVAFQPYWSRNIDMSAFTFSNFIEVFEDPDLKQAILNSVTFAVAASVIVVIVGYCCATILYHRARNPILSNSLDLLVSLSLGVPAVIFGLGFLLAYIRGPLNLYGQGLGVVLVYVVLCLPFATRMIFVGLVSLSRDMNDAAAACGAPLWRRVVFVELPLLRPALANAAALALIISSQEFAASVLVRASDTQLMGTILYDRFTQGESSQAAALALIMCLITAVGVGLALVAGSGSSRAHRS